jgi:hypothetical protein
MPACLHGCKQAPIAVFDRSLLEDASQPACTAYMHACMCMLHQWLVCACLTDTYVYGVNACQEKDTWVINGADGCR